MAKKYLDDNGLLYLWGKIKALFVQKETGKGLSTNDYTTTEKNKLAGIASGAEVNVNADWNAASGDAQILNKPTIPSAGTGSSYPVMDGTRALGSQAGYARVDHVHPTDTSRAASDHVHGNLANNGTIVSDPPKQVNLTNAYIALAGTTGQSQLGTNLGVNSNIMLDGATEDKVLSKKGTWVDLPDGVAASDSNPQMDGTASAGSSANFSRGDHVHPSDTTRVPTSRTVNGKALSADITLGSADIVYNAGTNPVVTVEDALDSRANVIDSADVTSGGVTLGKKYEFEFDGGSETDWFYDVNAVSGYLGQAQTALAGKIDSSTKGQASGVCPLDANAKVDSSYLPSYVDDVVEAYPVSGATELSQGWLSKTSGGSALTPEAGVIYVLMADTTNYAANTQFRWASNTYVKLNDGGVTSITNAEIDTIVAS